MAIRCTAAALVVLWGAAGAAMAERGGSGPGRRGRGRRPSREGSLKVGDAAPDFELKRLGGKDKVRLSSFKGKHPVVLVFGSYT